MLFWVNSKFGVQGDFGRAVSRFSSDLGAFLVVFPDFRLISDASVQGQGSPGAAPRRLNVGKHVHVG